MKFFCVFPSVIKCAKNNDVVNYLGKISTFPLFINHLSQDGAHLEVRQLSASWIIFRKLQLNFSDNLRHFPLVLRSYLFLEFFLKGHPSILKLSTLLQ